MYFKEHHETNKVFYKLLFSEKISQRKRLTGTYAIWEHGPEAYSAMEKHLRTPMLKRFKLIKK